MLPTLASVARPEKVATHPDTLSPAPAPRRRRKGSWREQRRAHGRPCPRCGQWRTLGQYPTTARVCGACADRIEPTPHEVLASEISWLASWETAENIAHRLGYSSLATLERQLYRLGRRDLVVALKGARP